MDHKDHAPVTRHELRLEIRRFATKAEMRSELRRFVTKTDLRSELKRFATKKDLERFATKKDLERFATKKDLERFATKKDLERFATKTDLETVAALTRQNTESIRTLSLQMVEVFVRFDRIESNMATKDQLSTYVSAVDKVVTDNDLIWRKHLVHDERIGTLEKRTGGHDARIAAIESGHPA